VSALQVLRALAENGTTLAKAAAGLVLYPQVLLNVPLGKRGNAMASAAVKRAVKEAESELAGRGRVLLRPSGTQPLIRVMVEGRDGAQVRRCAERIAAAVRKAT